MRKYITPHLKNLSVAVMASLCATGLSAQSQVGSDIIGGASGFHMQMANALSANGLTVAVGASWTNSKAGAVRIFELVGGTWTQKGSTIFGEATDDESGTSVSLSADGLTVAIGAPNNDDGGVSAGHVRVYRWNGTAWAQLGSDIDGVAGGDLSGTAVKISADGNSMIVGAHSNNGPTATQTDIGMIRAFTWDGSTWNQKGSTIYGENLGDFFGYSVSISADGNRIAAGGTSNDDGGSNAGHVRIYDWNSGTSAWVQVGSDINGSAGEESGWSIGLSHSGDTLVVGAPKSSANGTRSGVARIFEFAGSSAWTQVGSDIAGEAAGDSSGFEVGISYNGRTVVIGAPRNDGGGVNSGHFRIFKNLGSGWNQALTDDVNGSAAGEQFGRRVSISGNGTRVAGGSREYSSNKGVVRVYTTAPNTCSDGTVVWDGGGRDEQWSNRFNWVGDKCPCDGADVVFNQTNSTKHAIIRDTVSMGSITATTRYRGYIRLEGDTAMLTVGTMILQGAQVRADKGNGQLFLGNVEVTFNSMLYTGVNGLNVSGLLYIRGGQLHPLAGSTLNLNNVHVDKNGIFNSPTSNGIVNLRGYLRLGAGAMFRANTCTWNMTGNAAHDLSYNTSAVTTTTFTKLNIHNTASFSNDNIVVTDSFRTIGATSNVSGGMFQAQGRVMIGSSNNTMTSLTFNRASGNQILSSVSAGGLSGTPVVINKASSGNVVLASDVNFGALTLTKGLIDPDGNKATLTSNGISGGNNTSYIIGIAYVNKTDGALSGSKIVVPVGGNSSNYLPLTIVTSSTVNDWKIVALAADPAGVDPDLHSSLTSINSANYWTVERISTDNIDVYFGLPTSGSFDRIAWLDNGSWRSIGGSIASGTITSTENTLFNSTGTYNLTQGLFTAPPAPINVVADKDAVSGTEVALDKAGINSQSAANSMNMNLFVYPNPAHNNIQVVLPSEAVSYHVSDMAGRIVASYPASVRQLDLSNLNNGMYLITTEVNGTKQSIRFVKN